MKNARIIVVLVLLALSLSGCANAGHSEVSAPSLQETVTAEPVQSTVPQGSTAVSVSGSTEVSAESMVEPEMKEAQPEVSTPEKEETPPSAGPRKPHHRKHPNPNHRQSLRKHSRRSLNCPPKKNPQNRRLTFKLGSTMPKPMPKA